MRKNSKKTAFSPTEQQVMLRLMAVSLVMGKYIGQVETSIHKISEETTRDSRKWIDILDIPHPFVMGKRRETRSSYEELLNTILASEEVLTLLREAFIVELEGHYWGRFLFYIIKGGQRIYPDKKIYLSPLPKLFHPIACLACGAIMPTCHKAKTIRDDKDTILRCPKCKDTWAKIRDTLENAINAAYYFAPTIGSSTTEQIECLFQGCQTLYEYIYDDTKTYETRASKHPGLEGLVAENVSLTCIMPTSGLLRPNSSPFNVDSNRHNALMAFNEWQSSKPALPAKYFESEKISKSNVLKLISPFILDNPSSYVDNPSPPLNAHWQADYENCICLKDLDFFVRSDLLMG
jgi:hypothetical protein